MDPVTIGMILGGIQAIIMAAPKVVALVQKAKEMISAMFSAGLITKEIQDKLHAHIDEISRAAIAGEIPPAWQVEPDPGT